MARCAKPEDTTIGKVGRGCGQHHLYFGGYSDAEGVVQSLGLGLFSSVLVPRETPRRPRSADSIASTHRETAALHMQCAARNVLGPIA